MTTTDVTFPAARGQAVRAALGGRDRIFAPQGARLERLLSELGVPHDVKVYPDAGHSFMSRHPPGVMTTIAAWGPMAAGFDAAAEADSWRRIAVFFGEHLASYGRQSEGDVA